MEINGDQLRSVDIMWRSVEISGDQVRAVDVSVDPWGSVEIS